MGAEGEGDAPGGAGGGGSEDEMRGRYEAAEGGGGGQNGAGQVGELALRICCERVEGNGKDGHR